MTLLLLHAASLVPAPAPAPTIGTAISTRIRDKYKKAWYVRPEAVIDVEQIAPPEPLVRRVGRPVPSRPWEPEPLPDLAPVWLPDPQIPADIEALLSVPVAWDDDEEAIWLLMQ